MQKSKVKTKAIWYRLVCYAVIAVTYITFMSKYSPRGIEWRPFHLERVYNSLNNILNGSPLLLYGLTSFTPLSSISSDVVVHGELRAYTHPALTNVPMLVGWVFDHGINLKGFGELLNQISITVTGAALGELWIASKKSSENILATSITGITVFILFISTPWTYRMFLAPWNEVYVAMHLLLSALLFRKGLYWLGIILVSVAGFLQWHWALLLAACLSGYSVVSVFVGSGSFASSLNKCLSLGLSNKRNLILLTSLGLPVIIVNISTNIAKNAKIPLVDSNSELMYRVGIDSLANIHHGGMLGGLQFLAGNRVSICFELLHKVDLAVSGPLGGKIACFNCALALFSMAIASVAAVAGFISLLRANSLLRWPLAPLAWSFVFIVCFFQQSSAVHLQGYSYVFGMFFAVGLMYLYERIVISMRLSSAYSIMIGAPLVVAIVINSIRVSYYTPVLG